MQPNKVDCSKPMKPRSKADEAEFSKPMKRIASRRIKARKLSTSTPSPDTSPSPSHNPGIKEGDVSRGQTKPMSDNMKPTSNGTKPMSDSMKAFIRYLVVAVCSAIVTYLTSSCTAGLVIGHNQRQQQENNISTRADSAHIVPTITIR